MRLHATLKFLLVTATLGALSGCVTTPHEPLKYSKGYEPIYPTAPVAEKAATGSLFANSADSLVGRGKNFRVGDIITVLLSESAQANRSQTRDTSRSATNSLPSGASTKIGNISPFLDGINLNESTIESAGAGNAGQSATLRGEVAVTVVDVLPNGNLVLRGEKQLALSEGTEVIQISGVIRPSDVSPNNTVQSRRLANAQIAYRGDGEINKAAGACWATKLLFAFFPF